MSRIKKYGLKKFTFLLGLGLLLALGTIGIGYGAWNDLLKIDLSVATAKFEPQVEVYKIEREHPNLPARKATYILDPAIIPDGNGVITVNIGEDLPSPPTLRAIWDNAWRNDKYKVYYRVVNNSSIPIDYRTVEISGPAQKDYIAVDPDDTVWTGIAANGSAADNYAFINIRYRMRIPFIQSEINPFNLPGWGKGGSIDQTIARVEIKQFNTDNTDSGWMKKVDIHICTNEFLDLDPSDSSNNLNINSRSGSLDRLNSPAGGIQETGAGLVSNPDENILGGSNDPGQLADTPGAPVGGHPGAAGPQDAPGAPANPEDPGGSPGEPESDPQDGDSEEPAASGGDSGGSGEGNAGEAGGPDEPAGESGEPAESDEAGEEPGVPDDSGGPGEEPGDPGEGNNGDAGDTAGADDSSSSGDPE